MRRSINLRSGISLYSVQLSIIESNECFYGLEIKNKDRKVVKQKVAAMTETGIPNIIKTTSGTEGLSPEPENWRENGRPRA